MNSTLSLLLDERVASIRDVQKNPSKALQHITRVTRGSKTLGFFFSEEDLENLLEDYEAMNSKKFRARMTQGHRDMKRGKGIPLAEVARQYGL